MIKRGLFISVEGVEGVGKSTAIQFIGDFLSAHGIEWEHTREPGGTPIAEKIRSVLLADTQEPMTAMAELLLLFAGRAQNIANLIEPALAAGRWVVADRFVDASFAYQGGGRQLDLEKVEYLADWVLDGLWPDLTILLDAPVSLGLSRVDARGARDRIEKEGVAFFERVRQIYLRLAAKSDRFAIVDATQSPDTVQAALRQILSQQGVH